MFIRIVNYLLFLITFLISLSSSSSNRELISIDLSNIQTKELIKLISQHADSNICLDDKIEGNISLKLNNVTWNQALDTIVKMRNLVKYEDNGIIMITPKDETAKGVHTLLKQKLFKVKNSSANNFARILKSSGALSAQGKIEVDEPSNQLIVTDMDTNLSSVGYLIEELDLPAKQILIEARIVSADDSFANELGLELKSSGNNLNKNYNFEGGNKYGELNFSMLKLGRHTNLDIQLSALEKKGKGRIISKPKLLTTNHQAAYIESGSEIPYQEKTKEGNTNVAFKKAVLSLKVTPVIISKDNIQLTLEMNQDQIGQLLINGVPTIDTRKIYTQIMAGNNETIVLGGIYEWQKTHTRTGIPILKEAPVLKIFFGKQITTWERRELLIFVTPKILG